jgi:hemolysin activation/secretion protein
VGALLLECAAAHAAPPSPPPDAGQTLRELQAPAAPEAPRAPAPLAVEGAHEAPSARGTRFLITGVRIVGNSAFPEATLRALVADMVGSRHDLAQWRAAAARITHYYRERGYPVARAYIPAQDIRNGVLTIAVIEGRLGRRLLDNRSRLSSRRAAAYLAAAKQGAIIRSADIDRSLLLLDRTPGVGGSRATLQPGAQPGTSDLAITLIPAAAVSGDVEVDDYGNRYTGQTRAGGTLNVNSPLRLGDQLTLTGLTTGADLRYWRLAYQLPIGGDGWQVGAAYYDTHYRLGKDFSRLQAHGAATGAAVTALYPVLIAPRSTVTLTAALERRHLIDYVDATGTVTEKHLYRATVGLSATHRDGFGGGGLGAASLSLTAGDLDIDTPIARLIDQLTAETDGRYLLLSCMASRLQRLTARTVLSVSLTGQLADKNLDSSEQFSLGGAEGVRAYPQGEAIGDEGYLANLELRRTLWPRLQAALFYDIGSITASRFPYDHSIPNHRTLGGAGIALSTSLGPLQISAALAWRTNGGEPTSIPSSAAHDPLPWIRVRGVF